MATNIPISEVMTTFPSCIEATDSLERAKQLMLQQEYRHLPVMKDNVVVGILSERDINVAELSSGKEAKDLRVADAFVGHPYRVPKDEPLDAVLDEMLMQHIGSVLVLDDEKLVGIFTTMDACRVLKDRL